MISAFDKLNLPYGVTFILDRLSENGKEGYIVGGSVRDILRGKEPSDYDITTDASPDELKAIFSDMKTVEIGISHGTLGVMVAGDLYEVTTFRIDGGYTDARHPDSVEFTRNLSEDLSRRDFTVNAMAYNGRVGLVDLFSGLEDIKERKIRAVGDPVLRFSEDALRILRALRFSSVLDFEIDKKTSAAIFEKAHLLSNVSRERILEEWKKLIGGTRAYEVISEYKEVFKSIFSGLNEISLPDRNVFLDSAPIVRELSIFALSSPTPPESYVKAFTELRSDSKRIKFGKTVLCAFREKIFSRSDIKRLLSKMEIEEVEALLSLRELVSNRKEPYLAELSEILLLGEPYSLKHLKISGADITALGFSGEVIGKTLNYLLSLVIDGKCDNEREALILKAKELFM